MILTKFDTVDDKNMRAGHIIHSLLKE
ncbi:hypothetical protein RIR_e44384_A0A2N1M9A2_9GLOM [Rhizophagus irregularis DAOM 181602=DAOM 197198]|nr:hypothetical protein RIR_e44384_A0A2N1M9A2_9GLOM [Rhizophagus irregularis DAOM 181602=DAOM 197198]